MPLLLLFLELAQLGLHLRDRLFAFALRGVVALDPGLVFGELGVVPGDGGAHGGGLFLVSGRRPAGGETRQFRFKLREQRRRRMCPQQVARHAAVEQRAGTRRLRRGEAGVERTVFARHVDGGLDRRRIDPDLVALLEVPGAVQRDLLEFGADRLGQVHQRKVIAEVGMTLEDLCQVGFAHLKEDLRLLRLHHRRQRVDDVHQPTVAQRIDQVERILHDQNAVGGAVQGDKDRLELLDDGIVVAEAEQAVGVEPEQPFVDDVERRVGVGLARLQRQRQRGDADAARTGDDDAVGFHPRQDGAKFLELLRAANQLEVLPAGELLAAGDQEIVGHLRISIVHAVGLGASEGRTGSAGPGSGLRSART